MEKNTETIVLGSRVTAETTNGELASTTPMRTVCQSIHVRIILTKP